MSQCWLPPGVVPSRPSDNCDVDVVMSPPRGPIACLSQSGGALSQSGACAPFPKPAKADRDENSAATSGGTGHACFSVQPPVAGQLSPNRPPARYAAFVEPSGFSDDGIPRSASPV